MVDDEHRWEYYKEGNSCMLNALSELARDSGIENWGALYCCDLTCIPASYAAER